MEPTASVELVTSVPRSVAADAAGGGFEVGGCCYYRPHVATQTSVVPLPPPVVEMLKPYYLISLR